MFRITTLAFLLVSFPFFTGTAEALMTMHPLESPNGDFRVVIAIGPMDQTSAAVFYKGKQILRLDTLGFLLDSGATIPSYSLTREHWEKFLEKEPTLPLPRQHEGMRMPHPNPHEVRNDGETPYNESYVEYIGLMTIVFRAYDDGIAFRYEFAPGKALAIQKELTEFRFSDDYYSRVIYPDSEGYKRVLLSEIKGACVSPLVVEISDSVSLVLSEAPPVGFAQTKFQFGTKWNASFNNLFDFDGVVDKTGKPTSVVATLDSPVAVLGANHSSWYYMGFDGKATDEIWESLQKLSVSPPPPIFSHPDVRLPARR